ncbi:MAG: ABC transporter permease [Pseudomonadota bacterium]|jgi:ribose transport system permease protein|uniref:ABC transporter permease n=2 Tax=Burkholderiaceae TaxID=119060 RepID=UPI00347D7E43
MMRNVQGMTQAVNWTRIPAQVPGVAWMMALVIVVFTALNRQFVDMANLVNIGSQSSILLIIALPMTFVILTEGIDVSAGAVAAASSVALGCVMQAGASSAVGIVTAIGVGALFGLVNGTLISWLRLPPFVVTLGTMGMAQGLALILSGGQSITDIGTTIPALYNGSILGIPAPLIFAAGAYLLNHVLMYRSRVGIYARAIGGNPEALRFAGISVRVWLIGVYTFAGAMFGIGAVLLTARMSTAHPTASLGLEFDAIAAVIVGGTSFEKGKGGLPGTLLGVLTIGMLRNGLDLVGVPSSVQVSCIGVLVLLALFVEGWKTQS